MKHFWAIVFLTVPIFGVLTFVVAPMFNHWFPQDISEHGQVELHPKREGRTIVMVLVPKPARKGGRPPEGEEKAGGDDAKTENE